MRTHVLPGTRFGRLTFVRRSERTTNHGYHLLEMLCDCGKTVFVRLGDVKHKATKSCGCLKREGAGTYGMTHGLTKTREYRIWDGIRSRCKRPNQQAWEYYGRRGIKVCERWDNSFEAFFADMGKAPTPAHSIDRIDPDGDYEPTNCRWATVMEQNQNKRSNVFLTAFGQTLCLSEWGRKTGLDSATIQRRLRKGCSPEDALGPRKRNRDWGGATYTHPSALFVRNTN